MPTRHQHFQRAAVAGFIVVAFLAAVYRTESVERRQARFEHAECEQRNENIKRTNRLYRQLAAIERDNPFRTTSPETIARRVRLFESSVLDLIDCGAAP